MKLFHKLAFFKYYFLIFHLISLCPSWQVCIQQTKLQDRLKGKCQGRWQGTKGTFETSIACSPQKPWWMQLRGSE